MEIKITYLRNIVGNANEGKKTNETKKYHHEC